MDWASRPLAVACFQVTVLERHLSLANALSTLSRHADCVWRRAGLQAENPKVLEAVKKTYFRSG